ncbi:MAG TPA: acyl-CoA dehydrogenase, partial [Sphingobium sp.]|nr:acyl-CoA dehydrogenase [Sphingobium sp.]
ATEHRTDIAAPRQAHLLAALLDHDKAPWAPGELPPLAHWLLFPPDTRQSGMGPDGHPTREDDGLPRRMWAGSRVRFLAPILLGSEVERETSAIAVNDKQGRSGRMRFVNLRHLLKVDGQACIEEEQDIVYREAGRNGAPPPPETLAPAPPVARAVTIDPVQLFRFSALTFNAHRIHYDLPYTRDVEGYPGLVVHGPFIATLLMDHFLRNVPGTQVASFSFRAQRPIFAGEPFTLGLSPEDKGGDLMAIDHAGGLAMQARVDIR